MSEPIRMLHFADIHIGMENYGRLDPQTGMNTRVRDFLRRMDEMVDYAREHEVDLTIFAGDAFKTRTPNPTLQREFAYRMRELSELAPVVMLVGNHDLPPTALKASSIEIYQTLAVPNIWVANDYETRVIDTRRGPAVVGTAPYPIRARLMENAPKTAMTITEIDEELKHQMAVILDDMAIEADEFPYPRVLTGHFSIDGARTGSERQVMLGRDVAVMLKALDDPRWDYVAMGHVHQYQNLTKGRIGSPPVVYSGSMERIDFGEQGQDKGFCWVELERSSTRYDFVRLNCRPFLTLRADLRTSEDPTGETLAMIKKHDLAEAVVLIELKLTPETEARLNEAAIREAVRQSGASALAAIRKEIDRPLRARLGSSPEGLMPMELLERYLLSREMSEESRGRLLAAAEEIFNPTLESGEGAHGG